MSKQVAPADLPAEERPLSDQEREILASLTDEWVRPMDIGGRNGSDHSRALNALAKKGIIEKRRRNTLANMRGSDRGSYVYRNPAYIAKPPRKMRVDRLLEFTRMLAGYGCAGIDQEPDDTTPCGKCGPCEAAQFLKDIGKS